MISYPRWKIALVAVVLLLGIFLAVPNLFGEENALQLARDRAAVVDALVGLGRLAVDLGDVIESVDINPFVALPQGGQVNGQVGGMALDGLIILQRR